MIQQAGLINDNIFEYVWTLIVDVIICSVKSLYFLAETIFLTLLPDKFRTKKVSIFGFNIEVNFFFTREF